jgi:hypothetical protein
MQATWTQTDGLPDQAVRAIFDGYLWLGTYGGLARFDGNRFRNFTSRDSGLRHDQVSALAENNFGIWVGTRSGGLHRVVGTQIEPFAALPTPECAGLACRSWWRPLCRRSRWSVPDPQWPARSSLAGRSRKLAG